MCYLFTCFTGVAQALCAVISGELPSIFWCCEPVAESHLRAASLRPMGQVWKRFVRNNYADWWLSARSILQEHPIVSLTTFGDLLRQLRRRAGMTQADLAAAVGYSTSFICDLEQNRRLPTVVIVSQMFVPALSLQEETATAAHLVEMAALARGERPPQPMMWQPKGQPHAIAPSAIRSTRLPTSPTPLIGREQVVQRLCQRVLGHSGRLLTLVGPPGVGKTRLGLEVAGRLEPLYKDGARFIPLATITDPELVAHAISTELELAVIRKQSAQGRLIQGLRHKEILLLLDNFEQITAAAPLLATLLAECPGLHLWY